MLYELQIKTDDGWKRIASGRDKEGLLVFVEPDEQYRIVELNPEYVKIAEKRLCGVGLPLPLETV